MSTDAHAGQFRSRCWLFLFTLLEWAPYGSYTWQDSRQIADHLLNLAPDEEYNGWHIRRVGWGNRVHTRRVNDRWRWVRGAIGHTIHSWRYGY